MSKCVLCIILNLFVSVSTFNLSCFPQFLRQSSPSCIIDLNFSLFRVRFGTIPSVATPFTDAKAKEQERELRRDIKANLIARSKL